MTRRLVQCLLLLAPALPAWAQTTDEDMCLNGLFPAQAEFHLATVAADVTKLYFHDDMDGCPQKGDACRTKAYVVGGDRLLLGKTHGAWTCAWYEGKKHETVGWVRNENLARQAASVPPDDWAGKWKVYNYPGYVSIARKDGSWYVLGEMTWGAGMSTHFGELAGELKVEGAHAHLGGTPGPEAYDCIADLTRVGDFLVVHDNSQCGGVNVRFDGVYTRAR